MPVSEPVPVWSAQAVSSTTTYYSRASSPGPLGCIAYDFIKTGTAVGTLKWQINNLPDAVYRAAVNAASGATQEEKETNNTTGWRDVDLSPTDTIPIPATDPFDQPILLTNIAFKRSRLAYVNASSTGAITAYVTTS